MIEKYRLRKEGVKMDGRGVANEVWLLLKRQV